jgi:hypothetical protein
MHLAAFYLVAKADGYVYMTSNTRLVRAKVKVKKIARDGA